MEKKEKNVVTLPDEICTSIEGCPRDLVIIGIPKIGKGTILGNFTHSHNALVLDLERGGYDYISARKLSIYSQDTTSPLEAYNNYINYRKALLAEKGKYEYLIIDGLSDLDSMSEIGGTFAYMDTIQGKSFNRVEGKKDGIKLEYDDVNWKSVIDLPDGHGYLHTRKWFMQQIEFFRQISPYRIYAAHIADKYIKDNGKEEVVGSEISLTGKLKNIFASHVTALAKLTADGNDRYLNFDVVNDSVIAGSRVPKFKGSILISTKNEDNTIITYWDRIYKQEK